MTSTNASRRRQRSTRVVVAVILLLLAVVAVVAGAFVSSLSVALIAGAAAVVLGIAATKITHSEVRSTRIEAARDRAEQAQNYRRLTESRTHENVEFAADMQGRLAKRDATVSRLEKRLSTTAEELAQARRDLAEETDRADLAEQETERQRTRVADAETRATDAAVRVAELEEQAAGLQSELETWRSAGSTRKAV